MSERCGCLQHASDAQHRLLVKGAADDLQAQRQPIRGEPGRDRNRWQAGKIGRHGEDVVQIHRDRVIRFLADRKGS
jgi:hypothetical protein